EIVPLPPLTVAEAKANPGVKRVNARSTTGTAVGERMFSSPEVREFRSTDILARVRVRLTTPRPKSASGSREAVPATSREANKRFARQQSGVLAWIALHK